MISNELTKLEFHAIAFFPPALARLDIFSAFRDAFASVEDAKVRRTPDDGRRCSSRKAQLHLFRVEYGHVVRMGIYTDDSSALPRPKDWRSYGNDTRDCFRAVAWTVMADAPLPVVLIAGNNGRIHLIDPVQLRRVKTIAAHTNVRHSSSFYSE